MRANHSGSHSFAAARGVSINQRERVAFLQFTFGYPDARDINIAFEASVEAVPGVLNQGYSGPRLIFHPRSEFHAIARATGGNVVFTASVGGLQPVRGIANSRMP